MRGHHDSTILLCTHDMAEAEALADRVGILHHGELLCLATRRARSGSATAPPRSRRRSWTRPGAAFEDEDEEAEREVTGMIRPEHGRRAAA